MAIFKEPAWGLLLSTQITEKMVNLWEFPFVCQIHALQLWNKTKAEGECTEPFRQGLCNWVLFGILQMTVVRNTFSFDVSQWFCLCYQITVLPWTPCSPSRPGGTDLCDMRWTSEIVMPYLCIVLKDWTLRGTSSCTCSMQSHKHAGVIRTLELFWTRQNLDNLRSAKERICLPFLTSGVLRRARVSVLHRAQTQTRPESSKGKRTGIYLSYSSLFLGGAEGPSHFGDLLALP